MAYVNSDSHEGRYLQLEVTQTKGTSAQNYSTINWTLRTVGGGSTYYTTGPTTVTIDGVQRYYKARTTWSTGEFPAKAGSVSGSFTKKHNNNGTCGAVSFSLSTAVFKAAVDTHSGSLSMSTIPRYLDSLSLSNTGMTETTASFKWICSPSRDYTWYSLDGGAWTGAGDSVASDGKSGTFSISGLAAGSTHTLKVKLRRSDSKLESETNTVTFTTYKYPYLTSKPNFKIGDSLSIGFYNPLKRKVYIYIQNPKGTEKGGDNTTETSISGYNNEDWKNFFYAGIPDSSSGTYKVRIKCDTGNVDTTETGGTYTIRSEDSEKPIFDASYVTSLTNSLNTDISGTDKFIKNHNKLNVIIKPMGLNKSANGKEYSISATGLTTVTKAYSTSNISFEMGNMSTNTLNVTAYDKRGLYRSASKTITLVDYNNPKISNVKINRENGIGTKALIEVTGSYTNWSGLLKTNTIQTIQYRTKLSTASSYGSWTNLPSDAVKTVSNGTWKITAKLTDTFINTSNYNIQFKYNDLLETVESSSYTIGTADALLWRDLANKRIGVNKKPDCAFDVLGDIKSSNNISATGKITGREFETGSSRYMADGVWGLNLNNSDIFKINCIWCADESTGNEGLNFLKEGASSGSTNVDDYENFRGYRGKAYYNGSAMATETFVNNKFSDSGWKNFTLASGVKAKHAKYRLKNGILYVDLVNVTGWKYGSYTSNIICTLPSGYVPSINSGDVMAIRWICATTGPNWVRAEMCQGKIYVLTNNQGGTVNQGQWFDLSFAIPID